MVPSRKRALLRRRAAAGFVASLLLASPGAAAAEEDRRGEYEVKAAFLYNFCLFVEWEKDSPAAREGELTICVFGKDPFGETLGRTLAGKRIGDRHLALRRILQPEDRRPCALLFFGEAVGHRAREVLAAVRRTPILTVGEADGFLESGGILRFFNEGSTIRFEINLAAVDAAHLKISSKLLSLARLVRLPAAAAPAEGPPR